eukprot:jgi/Galph1/1599/GphlegSOOS_G297.1
MSVLSSEEPQLASLLESIFGETGFQVSVTREESYQVVDFEVLDPDGISCRNRISIFYVTPLYESDAGISYAPKFDSITSFDKVESDFTEDVSLVMKRSHDKYVDSLKSSSAEDSFSDMLRALFLDKSAPHLSVAHGAYRDRGLLISMNDRSLKFYNSIARNILFSTFLRFWAKSEYIAKLSDRYITEIGSEKGYAFEAIFFLWCLLNKPFFEIRAQNEMGTVRFEQSRWLKLQGHNFDPTVEKVTRSCWLKFTETHARLDLAYIDMESSNWNIYFMQLSISSFSQHNRGSAEIQHLFDPPERPQLASLLETIFGETGFQVSVIRDDSNQIVDFEVLDPNGMSCRNRITILYVTPLSESDVGISSAPKFVGFLTFESYPKAFQQLLGWSLKRKLRKGAEMFRNLDKFYLLSLQVVSYISCTWQ